MNEPLWPLLLLLLRTVDRLYTQIALFLAIVEMADKLSTQPNNMREYRLASFVLFVYDDFGTRNPPHLIYD